MAVNKELKFQYLSGEIKFEDFIKQDDLDLKKQELSSWNDHSGDLKGAYHNRMLKCFAYVIGKFNEIFQKSVTADSNTKRED